jgi:hypothetical protein
VYDPLLKVHKNGFCNAFTFEINKMKASFTQKSLDDFIDGFTGRDGMPGYDCDKPIKLYELNRDFVWGPDLQTGLITSILTGYPIPPITTCNGFIVDGGNRITTLWRFKNGHFSVKLNGVEQKYESVSNNRELSKLWNKCQILIVEITEATSDNISDIYENLNKGKQLTIGQLLENRQHIPIVDAALSIIGRSQNNAQYPHRELTNRVWNSVFRKSKTRTEVGFAFQLLVGTMYGPEYFHTSFPIYVDTILMKHDKSSTVDFNNLGILLSIVDKADPDKLVNQEKKSSCFRKLAGAMVYDMYDESMSTEVMKRKWQTMFKKAYNILEVKQLQVFYDVGNDRANNLTRLRCVSKNVEKFLDGNLKLDGIDGSVADSDEEYD